MNLSWLFSQRWQAVKFVTVVCIVGLFQMAVQDRVEHQLHNLNARGFISNRLEAYSRFEKEFFQVYDYARRVAEGDSTSSIEQAKLALDVLWSRVNTLKTDDAMLTKYGIDLSSIAELRRDLPALEAAIQGLGAADASALAQINQLWQKHRDGISTFSDDIGVARVKQLTESVSDQWELNQSIKWFQTMFAVFCAGLLLVLLAEMFWASRVVRRLEASNVENKRLAETDTLTGLFNRRSFDREMERLCAENRRVSVIGVDVDRFSSINNSFGHGAGDKLLVEVANRLRSLSARAFVSRTAGDEFALIIDGDKALAMALAEDIRTASTQPVDLGDRLFNPSVSIGVVHVESKAQPEARLQELNAAVWEAKRRGGGQVLVYQEEFSKEMRERDHVQSDLPQALAAQEVEIVVQPQIRLATGEVSGFEALVRWTHRSFGPISPEILARVADSNGMSSRLGLYIAERAFAVARTLKASGFRDRMSINISPAFGSHPTFVGDIEALLDKHGLSARDIELEVTEEALLSDIGPIRDNLNRLQRLGASVAIDDFGKGYSNITRLMKLAVSVIKIDRSAIETIAEDHRSRSIVHSIVDLAKALDVGVIAEGIETQGQADALRELGVDNIQGYLIARPMTPSTALLWMREWIERSDGKLSGGVAVA